MEVTFKPINKPLPTPKYPFTTLANHRIVSSRQCLPNIFLQSNTTLAMRKTITQFKSNTLIDMSTMKYSQYNISFSHCLNIRIKNHS